MIYGWRSNSVLVPHSNAISLTPGTLFSAQRHFRQRDKIYWVQSKKQKKSPACSKHTRHTYTNTFTELHVDSEYYSGSSSVQNLFRFVFKGDEARGTNATEWPRVISPWREHPKRLPRFSRRPAQAGWSRGARRSHSLRWKTHAAAPSDLRLGSLVLKGNQLPRRDASPRTNRPPRPRGQAKARQPQRQR